MADDTRTKTRIDYALKERDARIACHIVEGLRHSLDMLDEQPPTVLEPLIDYVTDLAKTDRAASKHRSAVREALRIYAEAALQEARRRERLLYRGIVGEAEADEDKTP
jgi:hypothetical protein